MEETYCSISRSKKMLDNKIFIITNHSSDHLILKIHIISRDAYDLCPPLRHYSTIVENLICESLSIMTIKHNKSHRQCNYRNSVTVIGYDNLSRYSSETTLYYLISKTISSTNFVESISQLYTRCKKLSYAK
ncbi:hypothetical protein RF11_02931 [Thelohanellus kitauei]|uniref:Uncharacterized protein n=1 Tax=Thelohanellus kitauei TaxID=669202 RepID=A0A0C2JIA3_THEKT|nr:hypothetical protein RF11_02931 [Thelohanellus kitauei]